MKKLIFNLIVFGLMISHDVFSQNIMKKCAIPENRSERILQQNRKLQDKIDEFLLKTDFSGRKEEKVIKIPVVIHVIHNNLAGIIGGKDNGNISDEQIYSQIKVLNEDYRKLANTPGFNSSPVGADMMIEFFLAKTDPTGKPTTGINRVYNSKKEFDVFNDNYLLSNLSYWDSAKYLNIWVTTLADNYLGYAEFPGGNFDGLELEDIDAEIDGAIIDHHAFGRQIGTANDGVYTYGRTLTHEIGHWFGLIHTWGDEYCGTDYCEDTPPAERGNLGTKCNAIFSECKGTRTQNMIENFMDYTADSCMNIFTSDQKNRVRAILELSKRRKKLIANAEFDLPDVENLQVRVLENPTENESIAVQILVKDTEDIEYFVIDQKGNILSNIVLNDTPSRVILIPRNFLSPGINHLRVKTATEEISKKLISR
ncbi:MAG: zinc metalloprotease [Cytophagaceae bacterium]|nr:zinc metalloprotease [Cytophagaceae bacterium]